MHHLRTRELCLYSRPDMSARHLHVLYNCSLVEVLTLICNLYAVGIVLIDLLCVFCDMIGAVVLVRRLLSWILIRPQGALRKLGASVKAIT